LRSTDPQFTELRWPGAQLDETLRAHAGKRISKEADRQTQAPAAPEGFA
jgi:hypothetical protein